MSNDMPLDNENPIPPLQSATIVAALKAMAPQIAVIILQVTGKTFDVDAINNAISSGATIITELWTIYYCWKAIHARINATQTIKKG